jgi:hypothetical protein
MTFVSLLKQHQEAIVQRWYADALATYPEASAAMLRRQRDRFANPVGHSLRTGTRAAFEALCDGADAQALRAALEPIVRIRAVQELSAPAAVGFVFRLKDALRAELGEAAAAAEVALALAQFERRIDEAALVAFDVFVQCRAQISELRINEVKRNVAWVVGKLRSRGLVPEAAPPDTGAATAGGLNGQHGERP